MTHRSPVDGYGGTAQHPVTEVDERSLEAPLVPLTVVPLAADPVSAPGADFAGVPGISGETAGVLGSVSSKLADAGVLAHTPLGAVGDPGLAAAAARADQQGRAASSLAPLVAAQGIDNSVATHDQHQAARTEERDALLRAWFAENLPTSTLGPP